MILEYHFIKAICFILANLCSCIIIKCCHPILINSLVMLTKSISIGIIKKESFYLSKPCTDYVVLFTCLPMHIYAILYSSLGVNISIKAKAHCVGTEACY